MRILLCLCAFVLGCGRGAPTVAGDGGTLAKVVENGELIVGMELGFPPFEVMSDSGDIEGFDVDLVRAFADDLEVKVKFEIMKWTALTTALQTGQIDMLWSGMTATIERSKKLLFSDTYFRTRLCLLVRTDSGIKTPADLKGKKLVVKMGTTGVTVAEKMFKDTELVQLPK